MISFEFLPTEHTPASSGLPITLLAEYFSSYYPVTIGVANRKNYKIEAYILYFRNTNGRTHVQLASDKLLDKFPLKNNSREIMIEPD